MTRIASRASTFVGIFVAALAGSRPATTAAAGDSNARTLLLVPDASLSTADGRFIDIDDEEILAFDPEAKGEIVPFLQDTNWRSLLGDVNRNGRLDDVPAQIDAITAANGTVASAYDLTFSFSSDRVFLGGRLVRDGDLVALFPGGTFEIVMSEAFLKAAIATSFDIDLDAAAFAPDGTFLFSLDDAVATTSSRLEGENGGSRVLPDETVFAISPGGTTANVLFRDEDVIRMVNRALGSELASVIDVQGLEVVDGEVFFTTGLSSGPGAGVVFSARSGGEVAVLDGALLDGSAFGLASPKDWNGLAVTGAPLRSLVLDTPTPDVIRAAGESVEVRVAAGTPSGRVRLLATPLLFPMTTPTAETALGGTGYLFLERTSPMYARSLTTPRTLIRLDERGDARVSFTLRAATPVMTLGLQAIDEASRVASHAIVIEIR